MNYTDLHNFYFELPLYTRILLNEQSESFFVLMNSKADKIDAYNHTLRENSTFQCCVNRRTYVGERIVVGDTDKLDISDFLGEWTGEARCLRAGNVIRNYFIVYGIRSDGSVIRNVSKYYEEDPEIQYYLEKIGQYPSTATLHISKIKDYYSILGKSRIKEFSKAIGLATNGVGIGSFVYLRRVFESLIEEAIQKASQEGLKTEDIIGIRMDEKIQKLQEYLPKYLVENRALYSILSKGVHELEENECLQHFEVVKSGIELILDEQIENKRKQEKSNEIKSKISDLKNSLGKNSFLT